MQLMNMEIPKKFVSGMINIELLEFSTKHPDALFLMEGHGEDGERCKFYAKAGHKQYHQAVYTYPEFDKGKLLAEIRDSKIKTVIN